MHDFIYYRLIRNFKENNSEERWSGVGKAVVWLFQNECVWLKTGHQWQTKKTIPLKSSLVNQWVYWDYWQEPVRMQGLSKTTFLELPAQLEGRVPLSCSVSIVNCFYSMKVIPGKYCAFLSLLSLGSYMGFPPASRRECFTSEEMSARPRCCESVVIIKHFSVRGRWVVPKQKRGASTKPSPHASLV